MEEESPRAFLDRLGGDVRGPLLALGRQRRYPPKSLIFFEGDDAHEVLVVSRGQLKITMAVEGREVVLDVLGPGDIVGELSAIDGRPRSANATALTEVDVRAIPFPEFSAFMEQFPSAGLALMRSVAGRLRDASRRQVEYGALDAVGRVCRRLVELMDRYGTPIGSAVVISTPLSQQEIAAWAGLSREAVVKALHALRALGWLTTSPGAISICDAAAVRQRASSASR